MPALHQALLSLLALSTVVACSTPAERTAVGTVRDQEVLALGLPAAPEPYDWVECPGGENDSDMELIGNSGREIRLPHGHVLTVTEDAIPFVAAVFFGEPRSEHVAVVAKAIPAADRFGGRGARLLLSWAHRAPCEVKDSLVIVQILSDGSTKIYDDPVVDMGRMTAETVDPITEFSTFAIAH